MRPEGLQSAMDAQELLHQSTWVLVKSGILMAANRALPGEGCSWKRKEVGRICDVNQEVTEAARETAPVDEMTGIQVLWDSETKSGTAQLKNKQVKGLHGASN